MKSSPPQVLHVITHFEMGGAEAVAVSLSEAMANSGRPAIFAVQKKTGSFPQYIVRRLEQAGVPWGAGSRLPFKQGGLLFSSLALVQYVHKQKPDILHLHSEIPEATWAVASRLSKRVRDTPVVRTIHNTQLWPKWGRIGRWAECQFRHQYVAGVSPRSLEGWRAFRAAAGAAPVDEGRTSVILNGIALPQSVARRSAPDGRPHVLVAGRLEPQKGVDLLPAIWKLAAMACQIRPKLTIIGTGSLEPMLHAAFGDNADVRILSPIPGLAATFGQYDVLLMPSRFEGLALMAVEAMMAGLPVVAADVPGLQEIFPAGYPYLAPYEDTSAFAQRLCEALDDRNCNRSSFAFDYVREHFDFNRVVAAYQSLYEYARLD